MKNNLFILVGEDKKAIDFKLFEILDNISYNLNDKIIYDMNVDTFSSILDEASMVSLFSSLKVIIVNNFNIDNMNEIDFDYLSRYIESANKDVYLIFITNKIDARKKNFKLFKDNFSIVEVDKVNSDNIFDYVINRVNGNGYQMDTMCLEYFISKTGSDINNINNELDKLFIYKSDDKIIKREDVELLIFNNIDNVIYEFTNAILDKDYDKIKEMYNGFMFDNIGIDYLISSVFNSIRTSLIIKLLNNKNMSNSEIAKVINKKEFFVKKSLDRLYRYTTEDLSWYINKLATIDRDIKSGNDNINSFELFLFSK